MREALSGLTVRGRAFLAAGLTAIVCSLLLGQSALVRVGMLLAILPLLCALLLGRRAYRLSLSREVAPHVVAAGAPATVRLRLSNEGRPPGGALLLEDQVPYVLGTRPRFVLDGVARGWSRTVEYQVRSDVRGQFEIGPMTVRVTDAFGMVELGRAFQTTAQLTVTPRVVPLPPIPLEGAWTGSGDNRPRSFASGSAEDVTVREYRIGDDLRRVHWRSSARTGELMVRREEQPWQSRATVFLDHRSMAHRGQGIASSFEAAVQAAASVAVHLAGRGYAVRLVTASGEDDASTGLHEHTSVAPLLESLAVVTPTDERALDLGWMSEHGQGSLTIAVLGSTSEHDRRMLRRMRGHASSALALLLDVEAWTQGSGASDDLAAMLTRDGWRTATLRPGARLDLAWQSLASSTRAGAST